MKRYLDENQLAQGVEWLAGIGIVLQSEIADHLEMCQTCKFEVQEVRQIIEMEFYLATGLKPMVRIK